MSDASCIETEQKSILFQAYNEEWVPQNVLLSSSQEKNGFPKGGHLQLVHSRLDFCEKQTVLVDNVGKTQKFTWLTEVEPDALVL